MAKKGSGGNAYSPAKYRRKGVHAKAGSSQLKSSKNYRKKYRGQGRP